MTASSALPGLLAVYAVGDTDHEFSIMSVSKPFLFALICEVIGAEQAREKLGANATGYAFNSVAGIERSPNGRTNPMVNAGAIATTSLVPGADTDAKWKFIHDGLSRFAGRKLPMNEEFSNRLPRRTFATEALRSSCSALTASTASRWRPWISIRGNVRSMSAQRIWP